MDPIIETPRLKLTLLTKAEQGSTEFEWLHQLHSDEQAMWWSIFGRSKTSQDTEKYISGYLPQPQAPETPRKEKTYRVAYAVHEKKQHHDNNDNSSTTFIGVVNIKSLNAHTFALTLPSNLTSPPTPSSETLPLEIAYLFLPFSWSRGFATESISALLLSCSRNVEFWSPWPHAYIRAVVNTENGASQRVMEKVGMERRGIFVWEGKEGEKVFLAGKWRVRDELVIYGKGLGLQAEE